MCHNLPFGTRDWQVTTEMVRPDLFQEYLASGGLEQAGQGKATSELLDCILTWYLWADVRMLSGGTCGPGPGRGMRRGPDRSGQASPALCGAVYSCCNNLRFNWMLAPPLAGHNTLVSLLPLLRCSSDQWHPPPGSWAIRVIRPSLYPVTIMISPKRSLSELSEPSKKLRRLSESSLSLMEDPGGQTGPLADPCLPSTSSHHHGDPVIPDEDDSNDPHLLSLPPEVLTNIIDDLDVGDVASLRLVNKFLLKVTESRYIRSVRLSASPPSSPATTPTPSLSSLSVLDLAVTYNLSQLPTG